MQRSKHPKTLLVSIITVFISLALLLCFYFLLAFPRNEGTPISLTYTIKIASVKKTLAESIGDGEQLLESAGKRTLGRVSDVRVVPAVTECYSEKDAAYVRTERPGYVDIYLTLSAEAISDARAVYIDGYRLLIGAPIYLRLPAFSGVGYCVEFEEEI